MTNNFLGCYLLKRPDWLPNTDTCSPSSETESPRSSEGKISHEIYRFGFNIGKEAVSFIY